VVDDWVVKARVVGIYVKGIGVVVVRVEGDNVCWRRRWGSRCGGVNVEVASVLGVVVVGDRVVGDMFAGAGVKGAGVARVGVEEASVLGAIPDWDKAVVA